MDRSRDPENEMAAEKRTSPDSVSAASAARARLYAAAFDEFVNTRRAIVAELKARGARSDADEIAKARKPSRTAWALNRVAHTKPKALEAFLAATENVKEAQKQAVARGEAAGLREATRALNAAIAEVVALARDALLEANGANNEDTHAIANAERAIARSLRTVPFASPEEVENLTRGTLVADIDAPSDFSVFGDIPSSRESKVPASSRNKRDTRDTHDAKATARERREEEAREKARLAEARRLAERAEKLEATANRAEESAKDAEREAAEAARHAERASTRAARARAEAARATEEAARARAAATAATGNAERKRR